MDAGSEEPVESDQRWDERARDETPVQRLDRNWGDLIQELRVVQTGVQFLTGFLLTLPFQQRFDGLGSGQRSLYLATVSSSILATAFLQAPVAVHRALFRRHQRRRAVTTAHRVAMLGIGFLALAVVGVAGLIFDVVAGAVAGIVVAAVTALVLTSLWLGLPLALRGPPDQDS